MLRSEKFILFNYLLIAEFLQVPLSQHQPLVKFLLKSLQIKFRLKTTARYKNFLKQNKIHTLNPVD
jgi:hypothetical protein